jgi:tetratricopeptide (TPR) repeat protein
MEDLPGDGAPEIQPPDPSVPAKDYFSEAEAARRNLVWEEAIRLYRHAVKQNPANMDAVYGLALSYEAKGREPGYESYLQSALAEYRRMIALDPSSAKAHDGLLAAAVKQDLLGDLLEEYKALIAKGGEHVEVFRAVLRKIQTLLLMKASPVKAEVTPPPPLLSFLLGLVAPGIGIISLGVAMLLRLKGGGSPQAGMIAYGLVRLSVGAFFSFFGYKIYLYWRVSR